MSYGTLETLTARFRTADLVDLTDDAATGEIDTAKVDAARTAADALIDAYCAKRYPVPLSPVPEVVVRISDALTLHALYERGIVSEEIADLYKRQIRLLEGISSGAVSLGRAEPDGTPASSHAPRLSSSPRVFSRASMWGW